jgi:hypothetical protein
MLQMYLRQQIVQDIIVINDLATVTAVHTILTGYEVSGG